MRSQGLGLQHSPWQKKVPSNHYHLPKITKQTKKTRTHASTTANKFPYNSNRTLHKHLIYIKYVFMRRHTHTHTYNSLWIKPLVNSLMPKQTRRKAQKCIADPFIVDTFWLLFVVMFHQYCYYYSSCHCHCCCFFFPFGTDFCILSACLRLH